MLFSVDLRACPVAEALNEGADIVVTGRIVDSAVVLGPLMHSVSYNQFTRCWILLTSIIKPIRDKTFKCIN